MVDAAGFSPPYDYSLVGALRDAGVDVDLIEPPDMRSAWSDHDASVTPPRFKRLSRVLKGAAYVARMRALLRRVDAERPDVVHFQWLALPAIDGYVINRLRGRCALVFTMHNTSLFHGAASSGVQGWNVNDVYAQFDRIIVHSEFGRRAALASGRARDEQLVRIPHGAFSHYAQLCPPDRAQRSESPRLLFVGSIKPYKGLDVLIRAFALMRQAMPESTARLVVAGYPSMPMDPLFALAASLGVAEHIDWRLRHLTERELAGEIAASHAVLLPYRELDQSGILLAAVAMQRTVIGSAIGGFPEIIEHERHGLLVPPGDPEALGAALVRFVSSPLRKSRFEDELGALAGGDLSWNHVALATISAYRGLHGGDHNSSFGQEPHPPASL